MSTFEKGTICGAYYKSLEGNIFRFEMDKFMHIARYSDEEYGSDMHGMHYISVTCEDRSLKLQCRCAQQSPHCDEINAFYKALEIKILETTGGYIKDGRYYSTNLTVHSFDISDFNSTQISKNGDTWIFAAYNKDGECLFETVHSTYEDVVRDAAAFARAIQPLLAQNTV